MTADNFIDGCERFFHRFEVPDALKVESAATFVGSLSGKRERRFYFQSLFFRSVQRK